MTYQPALHHEPQCAVPTVSRIRIILTRIHRDLLAVVGAFVLLASGQTLAATAPPLGTAANYTLLGPTSLTCTGSAIDGNVGTRAATISNTACTISGLTNINLGTQISTDIATAKASIDGQACTTTQSGTLDGVTLAPGVHCFTTGATLTGTLTLNGSGTDIWIFKIGTDLAATDFSVVMAGGGQACNVYWKTSEDVTVTRGGFLGTILSGGDATVTGVGTYTGRVLSTGRLTMTNMNPEFAGCSNLIINKEVIGGTLIPGDFSGTITGSIVAPDGNTWAGASTDRLLTTVGNYSVAETAPTGYTASLSEDCSGSIAIGETKTCIVTNTFNASPTHLIINKTVVGGTLTAADFSGTINGVVVATGGNTWTGPSTDRLLTTVGAYSVAETTQVGYTASLSADCAGTIAVGETKTCTVTNTFNASPTHLIINKTVVGGSLTTADFSGTISGVVVATGGNTWAGASTDRLLTSVGAYSVDETASPDYTASFSAGCAGTIAVGETKSCTVTNTYNDTFLPVPTLPEWATILLASLLAILGFVVMRRQTIR